MRILYLTAEQWPTFRVDITVLFGKYLPRFGIYADLVTEASLLEPQTIWPAGKALVCQVPPSRAGQYMVKFIHQTKVLFSADYAQYDAVQIRDLTVIALIALLICKIKKKPFFYWLSYPQSEGQVQRAKARGVGAGMKYWFPLLQGSLGKFLLYKIILPNADHIFVQSDNMRAALAQQHIPFEKMTPVPMGVDLEAIDVMPEPLTNHLLLNKRVLVYLGTLDRTRQIDVLFDALKRIKMVIPNVLLVLAGDTEDGTYRTWLKQQAVTHSVADDVFWTGWLPTDQAWRYLVSAELGLSPFPRGLLLDMASPTKAVEYMALGLPVIANDNPDQAKVITESGGGLCVALTSEAIAEAAITLLNDSKLCKKMAESGKSYINQHRGYLQIGQLVSAQYQRTLNQC